MNHRFKFRFWDTDINQMRNARPFFEHIEHLIKRDFNIMQFTGLLDKSGKEVYEGDILCSDEKFLYKVEWNHSEACFEFPTLETKGLEFYMMSLDTEQICLADIIGHIYEPLENVKSRIVWKFN